MSTPVSETRSPIPLLFRRHSSGEIKNLTSVSSSLLPAFGTVVNDGYSHLNKFVIVPYDRRYRWWQTFLVVLVVYSAWVSPFELAFKKVATGSLLPVDLVVDAFFALDILLTFFVAYLDKDTYLLVDDHKKIAVRYITSLWFPMDVASTLPFQVIYRIFTGKMHRSEVFGFLNLLRFWRLRRVSELFTRLEKDIRFSYFFTRLAKLICVTLLAVHSAGCFYYWLAVHHKESANTWIGLEVEDFKNRSIWLGYTYSIYWSIVTLTTVGYGDLHAVNLAVQGLTRSRISSLCEFEVLYECGSANRARAPTDLNPESSRSHSILMIQARTSDAKGGEIRFGKLHLIDLAGSEDNRRTGNSGARLAESGKINMSLFVLGKVITALNSGDLQRIPFRDSKLTRMLQDSLGGSSHAVMICNVTKSAGMYQECLHTLNYASKAKGIVNQVVVNGASASAKKVTKSKTDEKKIISSTAKGAKAATGLTKSVGAVKPVTTQSSAAPRLQKAVSVTPRAPVAARKSTSLSPPTSSRSSVDKMGSKLSAWRMAKHEGRNSLEKRNSADGLTPSIGIKRAASTTSATVSTVPSTRKPLARMSIATSALRVPMNEIGASRVSAPAVKKPRLSLMPLSTNTSLANSSNVRKPLSSLPVKRPLPGNSKPSDDKENVSVNIKPSTLATTANIVKDLSPVDLAKKLIGVAIDLEKKKQYTAAYSVFKRAYHVLPEENPKLVERLNALEGECPTAPSTVPSQDMSTAVYMQLVLEMNLLDVLNTGSQDELTALHSIGDKRAEKIIEARPFAKLHDLLSVQGITEKVVQKLHAHHIQW